MQTTGAQGGLRPRNEARQARKWEPIISAFMDGDTDKLLAVQRGGVRGRIFQRLVGKALAALDPNTQAEPVFAPVEPDPWYVAFAREHELKLRLYPSYNPDFVLADGTWVEATLSENRAYQKLFIYGHQAPRLWVLWLDEDTGLHKSVCEGVSFPNAEVSSTENLFPKLWEHEQAMPLVAHFERLRDLKERLL